MLSIILCDQQPQLVAAWKRRFAQYPDVNVDHGDLLDVEADAYVSPANSFGYMDGGIDLALASRFPSVERTVQAKIADLGGMLPVGLAIVVETGDPFVPYLISAPTMQIPENVSQTTNAFRAMLAALRAVSQFNLGGGEIGVVAFPGLCTGVGGMDPDEAALQMAGAYQQWLTLPEGQ